MVAANAGVLPRGKSWGEAHLGTDQKTLIDRERELLRFYKQAAADRARGEATAELGFSERAKTAENLRDRKKQQAQGIYDKEKSATQAEFRDAAAKAKQKYETETTRTKREYQQRIIDLDERLANAKSLAAKSREDARWAADATHEAARSSAKEQYAELAGRLQALQASIESIHRQTNQTLIDFGQEKLIDTASPTLDPAKLGPQPIGQLEELIGNSEDLLAAFQQLRFPKMLTGNRLVWLFVGVCALTAVPCFMLLDPFLAFLGSVSSAGIVGGIASWSLAKLAHKQTAEAYRPLGECVANQRVLFERSQTTVTQENRRRREEIDRARADEHAKTEAAFREAMAACQAEDQRDRTEANEKFPRLLEAIKAERDATAKALEAKYPPLLLLLDERLPMELKAADEEYEQTLVQLQETKQASWQAVVDGWSQAIDRIENEAAAIVGEANRTFKPWSSFADPMQPPNPNPAQLFRFGDFTIAASSIPEGIPKDERLVAFVPNPLKLPAAFDFPTTGSMLLEATDYGRDVALEIVRAYMVRLLACLPPAKTRFTIIDPVGLGENFAAFMHLADFEESIVTSRIWTEPQHIEQRLSDLTQTIENVIQKYLRNEFPSIVAYNEQAGEVAEPFRFVVVANFPAGFNDTTARRLISIASSGSRCGVYTLVTVDRKRELPHGITLTDLAKAGIHLVWNGANFVWKEPDFEPFPLTFDAAPGVDQLTKILHLAGERAKDANKVEVPFDIVAPPESEWWKHVTKTGIRAPIGRAGATKFQYMALGKGTSQHVLIAGKTGSGKSSLLHALITSLALQYSPNELELYLLDFKKGVEFKSYATHRLPHARVVGIESEREFGLSVLQRLDIELKERGDRFRAAGVQDLASFRSAQPGVRMPRVLLIVDEFQEFFVDDDRIAQEVALLLDRLVRQGRAFGIHVLLGSQTLSGAYSLARSTVGQMAVRVALQCSETDAHLILSDDNPAARLLSRPGEAIYNDANGLIEGNNLFQVVWLPDDRRDFYLERLDRHATSTDGFAALPQVVFEGNVPSDVDDNRQLKSLLNGPPPTTTPRQLHAWLGEAVAIKDPTAAKFTSRTGANLLFVGQQPEAALGAIAVGVVGLAAQLPRPLAPQAAGEPGVEEATFHILDGTPEESNLAGRLASIAKLLPQPTVFGTPRDLAKTIGDVAAMVERRQAAPGEHAPIFLVLFDAQRFRELRRGEDDFGFSRRDEPPNPAKLFGQILKEGPAVGVHSIVWCDSPNNVARLFDRQGLREFEMKVVFQMGANDSSNFIDSPLASKLGVHRAFFANEEDGVLEKFRPYDKPSEVWLGQVRASFRR